jgi:ribosomal protein L37E
LFPTTFVKSNKSGKNTKHGEKKSCNKKGLMQSKRINEFDNAKKKKLKRMDRVQSNAAQSTTTTNMFVLLQPRVNKPPYHCISRQQNLRILHNQKI